MPDDPRQKPAIVPMQQPTKGSSAGYVALAALVGTSLATALVTDTKQDEGVVYHAYADLGGVWSICSGSTANVKAGEVDTGAQCDARTAADLAKAAGYVLRCAPILKPADRHNQLRAAVRFQNNTGKFCSSSAGKLMATGRYKAGCDALLAYNGIITVGHPIKGALSVRRLTPDSKGRPRFFNVIRGLNNRRHNEHVICVSGL